MITGRQPKPSKRGSEIARTNSEVEATTSGGLAESAAYQIRDQPGSRRGIQLRPACAPTPVEASSLVRRAINAAKAARLKLAESPNATFDP